MLVDFEKWHGLENDFIVIWGKEGLARHIAKIAPELCHRKSGVGADGIIVLYEKTSQLNYFPFHIINQDGSFAKNCGNGLRCAAASYFRRQPKNSLLGQDGDVEVIFNLDGVEFLCQKIKESSTDFYYVSVLMPLGSSLSKEELKLQEKEAIGKITPYLEQVEPQCIWVQNPHIVLKSKDTNNFKASLLEEISKNIPAFNCHLFHEDQQTPKSVEKISAALKLDIENSLSVICYESGVGFTQACGSGACAVAQTEFATGLVDKEKWIAITMPGGTLWVKQGEEQKSCTLLGPAAFVFKGQLSI